MTELETSLMMELDMLRSQNKHLLARVDELEQEVTRLKARPAPVAKPAPPARQRKHKPEPTYPHVSVPPIAPVEWLIFDRATKDFLVSAVAMRAYQGWKESSASLTHAFSQCVVVQKADYLERARQKLNGKGSR